jgi:hypothetical protein
LGTENFFDCKTTNESASVGLFAKAAFAFESCGDEKTCSATWVEVGEKERVDQGRLSESGLADDHQGELEPLLDRLPVNLRKREEYPSQRPIHNFTPRGKL